MENVKVVVADDDGPSRNLVRRLLKAMPCVEVVAEAEDGEELIRQILEEKPHLVLLDINMPKLSGIHAIRECIQIHPELKVIVISGHKEYAIDAFDFSAVDYLVKPIERARLYHAVEKARLMSRRVQKDELQKEKAPAAKPKTRNEKLIVNADGMIYFLYFREILFLEKVGRKTILHTKNKKIEVPETLGALYKRLDPDIFMQTHRSYIVNFDEVHYIKPLGDTNVVYFEQYDHPAYISKNRMTEVHKYLRESED